MVASGRFGKTHVEIVTTASSVVLTFDGIRFTTAATSAAQARTLAIRLARALGLDVDD